ncbi:MAG: NADH kinase pos5 [Bogoriella megaspora]|nr:MAG: NADH kinase pos5 [Bogoriella megaspora]
MQSSWRCLRNKLIWRRSFSSSTRKWLIKDVRDLPDRIYPRYQETSNNDLLCVQWPNPPRNILLIKKDRAPAVTESVIKFAKHIQSTYPSASLIFEPETALEVESSFSFPIYSTPSAHELSPSPFPQKVDLTSTLGGDGTILHAASLFATTESVPPILSFSMGTLGFLGEWKFQEYKRAFREVYMSGSGTGLGSPVLETEDSSFRPSAPSPNDPVDAQPGLTGWSSIRGKAMGPTRGARALLRNRLRVGVFAPDGSRVSPNPHPNIPASNEGNGVDGDVYAMNEVIIHRGRDPHLAIVDVFVGGRYLTEAVADGMIISTPTGSTAYSLSSGGSIVHPLVSSLLLTPICPRSLSFRPLVLPANTPITLRLSEKNRGREVEVSVDGVRRSEGVGVGMEVRVQGEEIRDLKGDWRGGVPSIVRGAVGGAENTGEDHWVGGLNGLLKFNYPFGEDE